MELQCADLIDAESASWRGVFGIGQISGQQMPMSAFPETGRSQAPKLGKTKARFRPRLGQKRLVFDVDGTALHIER